ncbi:MAG: S-adenosylmethionine decarboxylase [Gemmatimonadales bacterium]
MSSARCFDHALLELHDVPVDRLTDVNTLSALVVAAAGAVGIPPYAPPVVRHATGSLAVGLLCRDGHIILHASPQEGLCLVDVVARSPARAAQGVEVITRRLAPGGSRPGFR